MENSVENATFKDLGTLLLTRIYSIGGYSIDVHNQQLLFNGEAKHLTSREFELLVILTAHAGQVVDRNYLLKEIWGNENRNSARSMDVYVCKLRKLLANDPKIFIINIHSVGYRMLYVPTA
jgi:DNA-binding response OmpR family regulator